MKTSSFLSLSSSYVILIFHASQVVSFVPGLHVENNSRGSQWITHYHRGHTPSPKALGMVNDKDKVNVNLIPDVDAFTLTAVGFALIAFNFFVLANMGDAGIGGFVARVINTLSD